MESPAKTIRRFDSDSALDSLPDVRLPVESSMGAELSGTQASGEGQASSEGAAKPEKQLSELSDMQHMASGEGMASTKGVAQEAAVTGEPGGLGRRVARESYRQCLRGPWATATPTQPQTLPIV